MIPSYWKSVNIGDPKLAGFFSGTPMVVEEKLDGSQFSFGVLGGKFCARSRGKQIDIYAPEKMFAKAVEHAGGLPLPNNVIFREEAITSNRHNTLCYNQTPPGYVVIFNAMDALTGEQLQHKDLAMDLGYWSAPQLMTLDGSDPVELVVERLQGLLDRESVLGGPKVEGVVVKRTSNFMYFMDRPIFAKLVSQAFREKHKFAWKETNPGQGDIFQTLVDALSTDARFLKSVQRMNDNGTLTNSLVDIGQLIKEVNSDILEEEREWIKDRLWEWAGKKVARAVGSRVPEWYKKRLMDTFVASESTQ